MSNLHDNCVEVLTDWRAPDSDQELLRTQYLNFLGGGPSTVFREHRIGHITASALVMDHNREHVLLTLHPKVGRWLQLGGHLEPEDVSLRAAATREVHEECGLVDGVCSVTPLNLDRHPVPCGRGPVGENSMGERSMSEHWDIQYLYTVPRVVSAVMSDESDDLRWFALGDLPELDASVLTLISRARA